jgi:LacI family transcriptional regulator, gluconate utilization system Gnt-I transcriptional repressor
MALGGLTHLQDAGISVPEEIGVVAFNGSALVQAPLAQLTTVDVPRYEIGARAAQSLIDLLEGKKVEPIIDLDIRLTAGRTTHAKASAKRIAPLSDAQG